MANLERLITQAKLKELAGAAAFERGEDYFAEGAVDRLHHRGEKVSAQVMGSEPYEVGLRTEADELACDCTCPGTADGCFCTHCVAVGLAMLDEKDHTPNGGKPENQRDPVPHPGVSAGQSPEYLPGLLMDQAQRDDALHRSLLLKAERASGLVDTLKSFHKATDSATRVRGFVEWRETGGFASDVDELVDSLEELLVPDSVGALVDLAEYVIERVDKVLGEDVHDSDGEVGGVLARLGDLHLRSCVLGWPSPTLLPWRSGSGRRSSFRCGRREPRERFFQPVSHHPHHGNAGPDVRRYRDAGGGKIARFVIA